MIGSRPAVRAPFPFVVGSGRSGTTMLRAMLTAHSELAIPPESHFVSRLGRRRARYELPDRFATERFAHDLLQQRRFGAWGISEADVREGLTSDAPADYPSAMRAVFALYARRAGKARYGDKTPNYVAEMPSLAALFPESRFVHIVRDGRNVTLSYLERDFGPDTVVAGALRWRELVRTGRRDGAELGPSRYLELRYEDLVERPEPVLERICEFLELRYEPAMLAYHENPEGVLRGLDRSDHSGLSLPPTRDLRDWRSAMSPIDRWAFDALAGDLLTALDYPLGTSSPASPSSSPSGPELRSLVEEVVGEIDRLADRTVAIQRRRHEAESDREVERMRRSAAGEGRGATAGAGALLRRLRTAATTRRRT